MKPLDRAALMSAIGAWEAQLRELAGNPEAGLPGAVRMQLLRVSHGMLRILDREERTLSARPMRRSGQILYGRPGRPRLIDFDCR